MFSWRLATRALPTKDRLLTKRVDVQDGCYLCGHPSETLRHLFLECSFTRQVVLHSHDNGVLQHWLNCLANGASFLSGTKWATLMMVWSLI